MAEGAVDLDPLFKDKNAGVDRQDGGEVLHLDGLSAAADVLLGEVGSVRRCPPTPSATRTRTPRAWHIDLDGDVRSLMSVQADAQWFFTAHHELGHVYYFISLFAARGAATSCARGPIAPCTKRSAIWPRSPPRSRPISKAVGVLPKGFKIDSSSSCVDEALDLGHPVRRLARGDDGPLRARSLSEGSAAGRVAEALVGLRRQVPGRGAAVAAARRPKRLRRVHQDPYQRYCRRSITTMRSRR